MDGRRAAAEKRLTQWEQVMRERTESGQSVKGFCEGAGIHENVYYYWQRKLRERASEKGLLQRETAETDLTPQGFAEVKLRARPVLDWDQTTTPQIRIAYAGVHISADSRYPTDNLATLLKELIRP